MYGLEEALDLFEELLKQSKFRTKYYRVPRDDLDYQFGIEGYCNIQLIREEGEDIIVRIFSFTTIASQDITNTLCLNMIGYNYISDFGKFSLSPEGVVTFSHKISFSTIKLQELEFIIDRVLKGGNDALRMVQEEM